MAAALAGSSSLIAAEGLAQGAKPATTAKVPEGWPVLKAGATAEEILKLVGKPDQVRPMATQAGKAEVWVYRRLAKHVTRQTAMGTEQQQTYGIDGTSTISVPTMKMERIEVYQVSSLLMFDGKLVTATQKAETERRFE